jgi:hypothetical protein
MVASVAESRIVTLTMSGASVIQTGGAAPRATAVNPSVHAIAAPARKTRPVRRATPTSVDESLVVASWPVSFPPDETSRH